MYQFSHVLLGLQVIFGGFGVGFGLLLAADAKRKPRNRVALATGYICALSGAFLLAVHVVGLILT